MAQRTIFEDHEAPPGSSPWTIPGLLMALTAVGTLVVLMMLEPVNEPSANPGIVAAADSNAAAIPARDR